MKKILLFLTLLTGFSFISKAQMVQKSPDQRAAHLTKALQKRLNLSADQAATVNSAYLSQAISMDSLKSLAPTDKRSVKMARKNITQSATQKIMSVLNDAQQQQFIQLQQMKKEEHQQKIGQTMPIQG